MKTKSDKTLNLRVPKDLFADFQEKCETDGVSVATALKQYMLAQAPKKPEDVNGWYTIVKSYPVPDALLDFVTQTSRTAPFDPKLIPRPLLNGVHNGYQHFAGADDMLVGTMEHNAHGHPTGHIIGYDQKRYCLGNYTHWRYHAPWPQGKAITHGELLAAEYVASNGRSTELAHAIDAKIAELLAEKSSG